MARPFFRATRIEVRLRDSVGALVDSAVLEPESKLGETVSLTFAAAPGSYVLEADIYNASCPGSGLVSSGISGSFAVAEGEIASVSFACLPVDPIPLADGVESQILDLSPFVLVSEPPFYISAENEYREERWFSYTASGATIISATPLDPGRTGYFLAVFDSQGLPVGSLDGESVHTRDGSRALSFGLNQGERYYIGCVAYGTSVSAAKATEPAVFTMCARTDLLASLEIAGGSGYLESAGVDARAYAAMLFDGSEIRLTADPRYKDTALSVDGAPATFGSPVTVGIGAGKEYIDLVVADTLGRQDARRIWIGRATALVDGVRSVGRSLHGEDFYFFMPVVPGISYTAAWPVPGEDEGRLPDLYAALTAYDEDGNVYFADASWPTTQSFTVSSGASLLIIRARSFTEGKGGTVGLTVSH